MTARNAIRALALGRVVIGGACVAAPALGARGWIGDDADRPGAQVMIRAFGIRDLMLGLLTLHVVDRPGIGPRSVASFALADVVDFGATLAAREHLPPAAAAGSMAMAGGAALGSLVLAAALRRG